MPQEVKDLESIPCDLPIGKRGRVYWTELMFSQSQHIGVVTFYAHPVAGEAFVHKPAPQNRHNRARLTEQSYTICM